MERDERRRPRVGKLRRDAAWENEREHEHIEQEEKHERRYCSANIANDVHVEPLCRPNARLPSGPRKIETADYASAIARPSGFSRKLYLFRSCTKRLDEHHDLAAMIEIVLRHAMEHEVDGKQPPRNQLRQPSHGQCSDCFNEG